MCPIKTEYKIESPDEDKGYATGQSSPDSNYGLPDIMAFNDSDAGISGTLSVNLEPYITSYKAGDKDEHSSQRKMLEDACSGIAGAELWTTMLDTTLNKAVVMGKLSASERLEIQKSPVSEFMIDSFVEIVKNLLDEAILGHYENGKKPQLELTIDIDKSNPDCITLTIKDNGRGFPPEFLTKNSTPAGRDAYIQEGGSNKKPTKVKPAIETGDQKEPSRDTTPPKLFGGAGLGLRILMAGVLHGDMLTGPGHLKSKYEKPLISEISLGNREDGSGALIQITTSRTPLQEKAETPAEISAPPIKLGMPPKKIKKPIATAPESLSQAPSVGSAGKEIKEEMIKLRRISEGNTEPEANDTSKIQPK
jgi:hypothetical protein